MTQRRSARDILAGLDADHRLAVLHGEDTPQTHGWDADPTPLTPRRLAPPFPVDALPPWVGDMVLAVADFTQTPLGRASQVFQQFIHECHLDDIDVDPNLDLSP